MPLKGRKSVCELNVSALRKLLRSRTTTRVLRRAVEDVEERLKMLGYLQS
jgi:hypothetical protein